MSNLNRIGALRKKKNGEKSGNKTGNEKPEIKKM